MQELLSPTIRLMSCSCALALLPMGVIPRSVRFALGAAALVWHFSTPGSLQLMEVLTVSSTINWSWEQAITDVVLGLTFAAALSVPAYILEFFAAQLRRLVGEKTAVSVAGSTKYSSTDAIRIFVLLLGALVWFSSGQSAEVIYAMNALAAINAPLGTPEGVKFLQEMVLGAAKVSFVSGLILVAPFLILSLALDFMLAVAQRYFPAFGSLPLIASTRFLVLTLVLTLSLYHLSSESLKSAASASRQTKAELIKVRDLAADAKARSK